MLILPSTIHIIMHNGQLVRLDPNLSIIYSSNNNMAIKKKALVAGAGGFIGTHLVKLLKKEGYWVRGVDLKLPEYSKTAADEFLLLEGSSCSGN